METLLFGVCSRPNNAEVRIIDMKGGASFAHFSRVPHVKAIHADTSSAFEMICELESIMWQRLASIREARANFVDPPRFKDIFLFIDEGGELASAYAFDAEEKKLRSAIMGKLSTLARIGREPFLHLVFGTQRPSDETLPVGIRGQLEFTICFRTENELDSTIILRHPGAEKLKHIPGRCIVKTPNGEQEVQAAMVDRTLLMAFLQSYKVDTSIPSPPSEPLDIVDAPNGLASSTSITDITSAWE